MGLELEANTFFAAGCIPLLHAGELERIGNRRHLLTMRKGHCHDGRDRPPGSNPRSIA